MAYFQGLSFSDYVYIVYKPNKSNKFFLIIENLEKRICVTLEDDVYKKLLIFKAKRIEESHGSCSYSEAINYSLRKYFF